MHLRAHHLLCLLGFRGMGYSPQFVENLSAVVRNLGGAPDTAVVLVEGADAVCAACPHLDTEGRDCAHGTGPRGKDQAVLAHLGARAGESRPWSEWQRRVAAAFDAGAQERVCGGCRWLSLGYCREGLGALRDRLGEA